MVTGHQRNAVRVHLDARSSAIVTSSVAEIVHVASSTLAIAASSHSSRVGHATHAAKATGRRWTRRMGRHHARRWRQRCERQQTLLVGHAAGQLATSLYKNKSNIESSYGFLFQRHTSCNCSWIRCSCWSRAFN